MCIWFGAETKEDSSKKMQYVLLLKTVRTVIKKAMGTKAYVQFLQCEKLQIIFSRLFLCLFFNQAFKFSAFIKST